MAIVVGLFASNLFLLLSLESFVRSFVGSLSRACVLRLPVVATAAATVGRDCVSFAIFVLFDLTASESSVLQYLFGPFWVSNTSFVRS